MEKMIIDLQDIDITDTPMFEEYAESKELLRKELQGSLLPNAWVLNQPENINVNSLIQSLPKETLQQKADSLIEMQQLQEKSIDLINYMANKQSYSYSHFNSFWNPILWQSRENTQSQKMNVNGNTIDSFDLDYMIAENLQQLYAGQDPQSEYYDWVKHQHQIEVDINTAGTTEEEIVERNTFISFLTERESEIRRIITLYSASAFNPKSPAKILAQEKLKFLTFKLSELRRLRERTDNLNSKADQNEEQKAAKEERQKKIALASDFVLRTSSFLAGKAGAEKALSDRIFDQLKKKNKFELREQIKKRKKQRRLWRRFIMKLRGISDAYKDEDDGEYEGAVQHRELRYRQGFSSSQYILQNQLMERDSYSA